MQVIGDKNPISEDVFDFMISYLPFPQKSIRSEFAKLFSISIVQCHFQHYFSYVSRHMLSETKFCLPRFSSVSTIFSQVFLHRVLNPFPNKPWFLRVCSKSLLKTLWEKEKLLKTSNFSFSHSVFFTFGELLAIFIKFKIWKSLKFVIWVRVKTRDFVVESERVKFDTYCDLIESSAWFLWGRFQHPCHSIPSQFKLKGDSVGAGVAPTVP